MALVADSFVAGVCSAVCVSVTGLLLRSRSRSRTFRINNYLGVILNMSIVVFAIWLLL